MRELQSGVWHWEAQHPEWKPGEGWDREEVSSYAIDAGERLLLFDPLAVPSEIEELAGSRESAIVLTCPWHRGGAQDLAEQLDVPLYVPPPDPGDPSPVLKHAFSAGDRLPVGVEASPGREEPNDLMLWVESRRTLRRRRHAHRPRPGRRVPGRLGAGGRAAGADTRGAAPAARASGRARAPDSRRARRPSRPRSRARLQVSGSAADDLEHGRRAPATECARPCGKRQGESPSPPTARTTWSCG